MKTASAVQVIIPSDDVLRDRQRIEEERAQLKSAERAHYVAELNAVRIYMKSGAEVLVPIALIDELRDASADDLHHLSLATGDDAISLRPLDVDIALSGLLRDVFGLNIQRRGGLATSEKKAAAARENGRKGGRPLSSSATPIRIAGVSDLTLGHELLHKANVIADKRPMRKK